MSDRYEALAKVISGARWPKGILNASEQDRETTAAVVEFLTSDEAVDRVAAVLKEQYGEFVASAWRINARAALLAAVGGSDAD